jgi:parallel beta-helix repeat protein
MAGMATPRGFGYFVIYQSFGGVQIYNDDVHLTNSFIQSSETAGVYIEGASPVIRNNHFFDNFGASIVIGKKSSPMVEGNIIKKAKDGIQVHSFATPVLRNNTVVGNSGTGLLMASIFPNATIENNLVTGNLVNLLVFSGEPVIYNSTFNGSTMKYGSEGGRANMLIYSTNLSLVDTPLGEERSVFFKGEDFNYIASWSNGRIRTLDGNGNYFSGAEIKVNTGNVNRSVNETLLNGIFNNRLHPEEEDNERDYSFSTLTDGSGISGVFPVLLDYINGTGSRFLVKYQLTADMGKYYGTGTHVFGYPGELVASIVMIETNGFMALVLIILVVIIPLGITRMKLYLFQRGTL